MKNDKPQAIYFDMDGTIADLYSVENWLDKLMKEDTSPYIEAQPLVDMEYLNSIIKIAKMHGIIVGVISWVAGGNPSVSYVKDIRKAKKEWLKKHLPELDEIHITKYGYPKHKTAKIKNAVLVDDNDEVREAWSRKPIRQAIDANNAQYMINQLEQLINVLVNN